MSLINEMLKRIQETETKPNQPNQAFDDLHPYMGVTKKPTAAPRPIYIRIMLNLILLLSVGVLIVSLFPRGSSTKALFQSTASANTLLQGLKVDGNSLKASATIALNAPAVYEVKQNYAANSLEILFNSAQATAGFVPIAIKDNLVRKVSILLEEGNKVRLVFNLMPGTTIQEIKQDTSKNARLKIVFANALPTDFIQTSALNGSILKTVSTQAKIESINELIKSGNYVEAEKNLADALKQKPHYLPFVKLMAELNIKQNKLQDALEILNSEKPSFKAHPEYYGVIASLEMQIGKPQKAVTIYNKLVNVNPKKSLWWIGLGVSLDMLGKNKNAMAAYQKARSLGNLPPNLQNFVVNKLR